MSRIRRIGLRREPRGGWPLDEILVGIGTLRTLRQLFRLDDPTAGPWRAWDIALWSGVSPQGSANSLARLDRAELVVALPPKDAQGAVRYRLDRKHPLCGPLGYLFNAERAMVGKPRRS